MIPSPVSLELKRTYNCKPQKLFDAWTKPEILKKWWAKSEKYVCEFAEIDLKVGGNYRFGMRFIEKTEPYVSFGKYLEIDEPNKLVFSWSWEHMRELDTIVSLTFEETEDGKTKFTLTHDKLPNQEVCDSHNDGWTGVLDRLKSIVE